MPFQSQSKILGKQDNKYSYININFIFYLNYLEKFCTGRKYNNLSKQPQNNTFISIKEILKLRIDPIVHLRAPHLFEKRFCFFNDGSTRVYQFPLNNHDAILLQIHLPLNNHKSNN